MLSEQGGNTTLDTVYYGTDPSNLSQSSEGYSLTYTYGGWLGFIHRAIMVNLEPNTLYFYTLGTKVGGQVYNFTTYNDASLNVPFNIAVVGDMGANDNPWSPINIAYLNAAVEAGQYQTVIHVGDVSYADGYQASWDLFFEELQPTMTRVPYQAIPGNHELIFNFTAFTSRFYTSGLGSDPVVSQSDLDAGLSGTNMWSSYDIGCVHFIGLSSEDNFDSAWIGENQLEWLKQDLERTKRRMIEAAEEGLKDGVDQTICSVDAPTFIVVYLHRPLCTYTHTNRHES